MFCPVCKAEYREGFTRCADCDVDLVEALEAEEELEYDIVDDNITFVEILKTSDMGDISLLKSMLDSEDIQYFFKGDSMYYISHANPAVLMVAEYDASRAVDLIKDIKLNYFKFIYRNY